MIPRAIRLPDGSYAFNNGHVAAGDPLDTLGPFTTVVDLDDVIGFDPMEAARALHVALEAGVDVDDVIAGCPDLVIQLLDELTGGVRAW